MTGYLAMNGDRLRTEHPDIFPAAWTFQLATQSINQSINRDF